MMTFTIYDIFQALKKSWRFIVIFTSILTLCSIYLSFFYLTPIYSNTSTLLVNERNQPNSPLTVNQVLLYEKLMGTYKDVIVSNRILNPVLTGLKPQWPEAANLSLEQLRSLITVSTHTNSQIINISVNHANYLFATNLANKLAEQFSTDLRTIMTIDNVQILDRAETKPNPHPIKPSKFLNVFLAFIFGFLLSANISLMIHLLDRRIKSDEDLTAVIDISILGSIPKIK